MTADPRALRNNLRLFSGLVLLGFVLCHLTAFGRLRVRSRADVRSRGKVDMMLEWAPIAGQG